MAIKSRKTIEIEKSQQLAPGEMDYGDGRSFSELLSEATGMGLWDDEEPEETQPVDKNNIGCVVYYGKESTHLIELLYPKK